MTLQDYFNKRRRLGNVLLFGKILNEINDSDWGEIIKGFTDKSSFSEYPEYYICVSHSESDPIAGKGQQRVEELVNIINKNDEFEVDWKLPEQRNKSNPLLKVELSHFSNKNEDDKPCYCSG